MGNDPYMDIARGKGVEDSTAPADPYMAIATAPENSKGLTPDQVNRAIQGSGGRSVKSTSQSLAPSPPRGTHRGSTFDFSQLMVGGGIPKRGPATNQVGARPYKGVAGPVADSMRQSDAVLHDFDQRTADYLRKRGNKNDSEFKKTIGGTLENAMAKVDSVLGKLKPEQRQYIKGYLERESNGFSITHKQIQEALLLAGSGMWNWLREPGEVVRELPFTLLDLTQAMFNSRHRVKEIWVPTRDDGKIPLRLAMKMAAYKLNVPLEQLESSKIIGKFVEATPFERSPIPVEQRLDPLATEVSGHGS